MCFWKDVEDLPSYPTSLSVPASVRAQLQVMRASWGRAHNIAAYLSTAATSTKYGNLDQGICPVTVYISLIVSASSSSQSIHYFSHRRRSCPLSWWGGMDRHQNKEEAIIKDGGTMSRPLPGSPPVWEHDAPLLRFCVTFLATQTASRHSFRAPSVLQRMSTNMLWRIMFTARGESLSLKPKKKKKTHKESSLLTICLGDSWPEELSRDPIQELQGGILRQTRSLCIFDVLFSALRDNISTFHTCQPHV